MTDTYEIGEYKVKDKSSEHLVDTGVTSGIREVALEQSRAISVYDEGEDYPHQDVLTTEEVLAIQRFKEETEAAILTGLYYSNPNLSMAELAKRLSDHVGKSISPDAADKILAKRRSLSLNVVNQSTNVLLAEELNRINALEQIAFDAFLRSQDSIKRRVIDEVMRENKDTGDIESIIANVRTIKDFSPGDINFLKLINDLQKERRKVLGAYSPERTETTTNITVKPYVTISPEDWDDSK